ncbi:hypothetical protein [Marinococcus luteus]|uniref:hypothetical protein n=1 Tax=Marinococcus luteus TaxID=1122204 RepID=UPI0015A0DB11|nr:hypothetical protein [Marinococcus luteus]
MPVMEKRQLGNSDLQVTLTGADMKAIDDIASKGAAAGMRYPEEGMKTVNR